MSPQKKDREEKSVIKETNLLLLAQAFIISRIVYVVSYQRLDSAERKKIDIIIRNGITVALSLPPRASTDRIMQMGASNTCEKFVEAALTAQHHRRLETKAARR